MALRIPEKYKGILDDPREVVKQYPGRVLSRFALAGKALSVKALSVGSVSAFHSGQRRLAYFVELQEASLPSRSMT